jgi:hypothetical protein
MTSTKTRALAIFLITSFVLAVVFFVFPIRIFDGEIHVVNQLQDYTVDAQMSLSYFVGIGLDEADMQDVESFRLTAKGWAMAAVFIFGLPALLAYRIYLKYSK